MTTIIAQFDDATKLEKAIAFFNRLKIPFQNISKEMETTPNGEELSEEVLWVRQQLTEKHIKTGEWDKMDDEDRQDAVLGEMMLFSQAQPDYEVYSVSDTKNYLANLKKELYAVSGH